jgi:hypothetical protein
MKEGNVMKRQKAKRNLEEQETHKTANPTLQ